MNLIVNVDLDWGIGRDGQLLVHLREDMQHFKALTTGHVIVLGRKTLATFPHGRPLPNRTNIILTRDQNMCQEGVIICHNLIELTGVLSDYPSESVFVVGGESVYHQLLPFCSLAHVTRVHHHMKADTFFPNLDRSPSWLPEAAGPIQSGISRLEDQDNKMTFQFCLYRNKQATHLNEWIRERGEISDEDI